MADEEKKVEEVEEVKEEEAKADEPVAQVKEEVKAEAPAKVESAEPAEAKKKAAPSGKFADLIKQIEELSVADLADLVKELEERFGVSAAAPMAMAGGAPAAGGAVEDEKDSYTVMLKDAGAQKIAVIKAVRQILPELGLKEAKDLVDGAPKEVKKDMPKAEAEEAKRKLETAGASVELI